MSCRTNYRVWVRTGPIVVAVLVLSGCASNLVNKVFSRSAEDVPITGEWTPANIILGDPQVFTRATLLNDRRREQRFIRTLIEESRNQKFEPQLQRDLRTLAIAMAQLGVSIDPAAQANFKRERELSELEHEVNKRRLRAEIARLDAQIERIRNQASAEVPPPADRVDLSENALETPSGAPSADVDSLLKELKSKITAILDDVGDSANGRVAASDAAASPEDSFRDLQAYRGLLRAYEASNALDDTHDLGGNTLYRIQFRATVNPESIRNRFGVIEVVLVDSAPKLSDEEVALLYWNWLAHITRQLNQQRAAGLATLSLLPEYARLFGTVALKRTSHGGAVYIAVPPAYEEVFRDAFERLGRPSGPKNKARQLEEGIGYLRDSTDFDLTDDVCPIPKIAGQEGSQKLDAKRLFPQNDQLARSYSQHLPSFLVVLSNLIELSHNREIDLPVAEIESLSNRYRRAFDTAREYVRERTKTLKAGIERLKDTGENGHAVPLFEGKLEGCRAYLIPTKFDGAGRFPEKFKTLVNENDGLKIRVLDVMPVERAQRVSTLASAAASLQTALSIAAALPSAGIGIDAGFNNLKSEIGKIEARERVPLVVGFFEGEQAEHERRSSRFGWVLGPPLKPDLRGSRFEHSQVLKSHELQVDLSVPAWWPSVKLSVHTAWAGPLGGSVMESCNTCEMKTFDVPLPRSESDMDALTQFLFSSLSINHPIAIASDRPRIVEVSPTIIDRSAGEVVLIVRGSGLWRGEDVFVYGVRQTDVKVLPDMSGLAVALDTSRLSLLSREIKVEPLAVFTRAGKAVFRDLELIESRTAYASRLALVPVLPYHINNTRLEIRLRNGSFPLGTSPKIAFRPSVEGQNYKFMESDATLTASRSLASATVEWSGGVTMVNGNDLAVRYLFQPDDNAAPIWSDEVFLIYYASKTEAAAAFDDLEVTSERHTPVRVELQLPARAAEAYPLLFDADTKVETISGTAAMLRNDEGLEVLVTPPDGGFAKGTIKLKFRNWKAGPGALPEIGGAIVVK